MIEDEDVAERFRMVDGYAERQMIACALWGRTDEFMSLPAEAITSVELAIVATVVRSMVTHGLLITPETVMRTVIAEATGRNQAERMSRVMADCTGSLTTAESAPFHAERLRMLYAARTVSTAFDTARRHIAYSAWTNDDQAVSDALTKARSTLDAAAEQFAGLTPESPLSVAELIEGEDTFDWLVPGLLERTDRLIVTGFEGHGKSYLTAQFALGIGAGLHPFTGDPIPGLDGGTLRTLVFDCENSRGQLRRRYRRIAGQVDRLRDKHGLPPADWKSIVRVVSRPEGVNLATPNELARLEQAVSTVVPDLLVCGPLYKMSSLDIRDEQAAQTLTLLLDGLRVRHGFALMMEGHAGHSKTGEGSRSVRPIGSSLFLRWPEFGFGIKAHPDHVEEENPTLVNVVPWRGSRDERDWPLGLRHGSTLPWVPTEDYWDRRPVG